MRCDPTFCQCSCFSLKFALFLANKVVVLRFFPIEYLKDTFLRIRLWSKFYHKYKCNCWGYICAWAEIYRFLQSMRIWKGVMDGVWLVSWQNWCVIIFDMRMLSKISKVSKLFRVDGLSGFCLLACLSVSISFRLEFYLKYGRNWRYFIEYFIMKLMT